MAILDNPEIRAKYEILEKLGEGGMGAVYKARHRFLDEVRVIKTIRPQLEEDPELRARFQREAQVASRLDHPRIARLYDYSVDESGGAFIVMEFVAGTNLGEYLKQRGGSLAPTEAVEIGRQALEALGYLHTSQFVHRDVSIDNLMVSRDAAGNPSVTLIDLGLVRSFETMDYRTKTGMVMGKMHYLSPEQLDSRRRQNSPVDARSDLYALGILLFLLLTGEHPIEGDDPPSIITGHLLHPPKSFTAVAPRGDIPPALQAVVLKALEKEPASRWQDATGMSMALVGSLRSGQAEAPTLLMEETLSEETRAREETQGVEGAGAQEAEDWVAPVWLKAVGVVLGVLLLAGSVFFLSRFRELPAGRPDLEGQLSLGGPVPSEAEAPLLEGPESAGGAGQEPEIQPEEGSVEAPLVPASELVEEPLAPPPPSPVPRPLSGQTPPTRAEPPQVQEDPALAIPAPLPDPPTVAPTPPAADLRSLSRALARDCVNLATAFEDYLDEKSSETDAEEDLEDYFDDMADEAEELEEKAEKLAGDLGISRRQRISRNFGKQLADLRRMAAEVESLSPGSVLPASLAGRWSRIQRHLQALDSAER